MAGAVYLADTTVYVLQGRHQRIRDRFDALLLEGRLAACQLSALEYLNNAPDPRKYDLMWRALHGQRWIDVTTAAMDRAMEVHRQLARKSQHRLFSLPDLIIAATAELNGATVLHYDEDFDRIAEVTGQPVEWVAEKGARYDGPGRRVSRYLVVSATKAEAAYVPEGLPVVVTGLGKTAAAVATAAALATRDRTGLVVLNIGTAGALRDGLTGLFTPGTVLNHDMNGDAVRALGYDPQDLLEIPGGDATVLATGDVFVTDPVVRDRLAGRAHLVDMEGYAVAYACRRFGVPVRLVKHVSDDADETATDWPARVDASAAALGAWLRATTG